MRDNLNAALELAARGWRPRFTEQIEIVGDCWIWQGRRDKDGYGIFHAKRGSSTRAHRYAYGAGPHDRLILHHCDTPACVKPEHLYEGTPADNMRDKMARGRHVSGMQLHPERAARGESTGAARLNRQQIVEIRALQGVHGATLVGRRYGVTKSTVQDIWQRRTWKWLP